MTPQEYAIALTVLPDPDTIVRQIRLMSEPTPRRDQDDIISRFHAYWACALAHRAGRAGTPR